MSTKRLKLLVVSMLYEPDCVGIAAIATDRLVVAEGGVEHVHGACRVNGTATGAAAGRASGKGQRAAAPVGAIGAIAHKTATINDEAALSGNRTAVCFNRSSQHGRLQAGGLIVAEQAVSEFQG